MSTYTKLFDENIWLAIFMNGIPEFILITQMARES
jgi:hypothetical protein